MTNRRFTTCVLILFAAALSETAFAQDAFRRVLTSSVRNVRTTQWMTTSRQVTPDCPIKWSVRKVTLHGGKQEGSELIIVDNGRLQFVVVPTRGMGILSAQLGDVRLGWNSPVKEVVHPKFINLQSRSGLGWLEGFNEWMCRCGLESNGQAGTDEFINNLGDKATMELTLHGKIANLPASHVEVVVDRSAPFRIHVRGRVDERMFYGPKLELETEISTEPGSNTFRISDVVTNRGAQPQEFEMLYHSNYGSPFLEEGSTFVGAAKRVTPFNSHAAKSVTDYQTYVGPTLGFIEQVYLLRLFGDENQRTTIMLQNSKQDRGISMSWSLKQLPYLTIWKNTAAIKDGYVTGLEPGTNYPNNRSVERKFGRVPKLKPGSSQKMSIDFGIHVGAGKVKKVAESIRKIQGDRESQIDAQPDAPK